MRKKLIFTLLITIFIFACQGGNSNAEENQTQSKIQLVNYTILASGAESGITQPGDIIIETQAKLDSIWKQHYSYRELIPEQPEIDFSKELVVGVFLGEQPSTGYWVRLDSVYVRGSDQIIALSTNDKADTTRVVLPMKTQPFVLAATSKTGKHISFDFKVEK